jgi:hypothetical protein
MLGYHGCAITARRQRAAEPALFRARLVAAVAYVALDRSAIHCALDDEPRLQALSTPSSS